MEYETANSAWLKNIQRVLSPKSQFVRPRGIDTLEVLNNTSVIDMQYPVVTIYERKMGFRFMCAEAHWILSGDNRVETIAPYASAIKNFSDDGYRFQGAYGPKVTEQLRYVVDTLHMSRFSRQAVISIWRESPRHSKDIPCTLTLQFIIRPDSFGTHRIHCIANMRSSDLWLGWVYDVFNFTMITTWIGIQVRDLGGHPLQLGNLYLNAGSQHIYERNLEDCKKSLAGDAWDYDPLNLSQFNTPMSLMSRLAYLRDIKRHKVEDTPASTPTGFLAELESHAT